MKKIIAWILICVMAAAMLTACGEKPVETQPNQASKPVDSGNSGNAGEDAGNTGKPQETETVAPPADNASQGLEFQLNEDGKSYMVTGMGSCSDTHLVIPAQHEGLPVTAIRQRAFSQANITELTLPDSIVEIGNSAFERTALTSVTIPGTVKTVMSGAFFNCTKLMEAVVEEGVEVLERDVFGMCYTFEKLTLPSTIKSLGENIVRETAYYKNAANWENGVMYIGSYLITADPTLSGNYTVKDGTTVVAGYAFNYCSELTGVVFPSGIQAIGEGVFNGCEKLASVTLPDNPIRLPELLAAGLSFVGDPETWEGDSLYFGNHLIEIRSYEDTFTIKDGTLSLADKAMGYCYADTVVVPASVQYIGKDSLYNGGDVTIQYQGTKAQWEAIEKHEAWDGGGAGRGTITVEATDGTVGQFGVVK